MPAMNDLDIINIKHKTNYPIGTLLWYGITPFDRELVDAQYARDQEVMQNWEAAFFNMVGLIKETNDYGVQLENILANYLKHQECQCEGEEFTCDYCRGVELMGGEEGTLAIRMRQYPPREEKA